MRKIAEHVKRAVKDVKKAVDKARPAKAAPQPNKKAEAVVKRAGQNQKKAIVKQKTSTQALKTSPERSNNAARLAPKSAERGGKARPTAKAAAPATVNARKPVESAGKTSSRPVEARGVKGAVAEQNAKNTKALGKASAPKSKPAKGNASNETGPVVAAVGAIGVVAPSAPAVRAEKAPEAVKTPAAPAPAKAPEPATTLEPASASVAPRKPEPALDKAPNGAAPVARTEASVPPLKKAPEAAGAKKTSQRQGFKTLEFIVYPAHGVGQIVAIEEQEVAGYRLELFVISFAKDKMTLRVPTMKVGSVGMRKLAEPNVVTKALETLKGRARVKRTMWSRRAQEYEAKINSGDIVAIAEVVRDLYRSESQPEQSYSERQLYEAALDRLSREIAAVERLTETEAVKQIEAALAKGPRRGPKPADEADAEDGVVADEAEAA